MKVLPGYHRRAMQIEYEVKLPGERDALLAALACIGARPSGPRTLEDDLVLDTPERRILAQGGLLRLRRRGDRFLLTLKGASDRRGEVKAMSEVETEVADGAAMRDLLARLGFAAASRYQKYRTPYTCPLEGCETLALTLDETPLGAYLEVEGEPRQIHRCTAALGFARDDYEVRSYLQIHRDRGGAGEMLFDGPEATPWTATPAHDAEPA